MEDRSISVYELPRWVWIMMIALLLVPIALFGAVTGSWDFLGRGWDLIGWLVLLVLAHEAVHALAWKGASGLPWSAFSFGILWTTVSPYCHADQPMTARAYRIGAATPLFVTGLLPWGAALWWVSGPLALASAVLISGAGGDLFVLWTLRDLAPHDRVRDHPERVGCLVERV